jgi:hypothetical protein
LLVTVRDTKTQRKLWNLGISFFLHIITGIGVCSLTASNPFKRSVAKLYLVGHLMKVCLSIVMVTCSLVPQKEKEYNS